MCAIRPVHHTKSFDFQPDHSLNFNLPLQTNWHRHYDSTIGQWLSEDEIGYEAGEENLRSYVGSKTISERE